jgi:hypothetical protein
VEGGDLPSDAKPAKTNRWGSRFRAAESHLTVWDFAAALLVVAIAAWLRHRQLGPASLWLDDAWPALVIKTPWRDVTTVGLTAPGFAALLKVWLHVTGFSASKAQSLAFAFGIVAPALLGLLCVARRIGRPAALVATALLLTSPAHIVYSARVKQYTLDSTLVIILVWLTWRGLERPDDTRRWFLLAFGAAAATAISSGLVPVVAGAMLTALVAVRAVETRARRAAYAAVAAYAVFAAAWWKLVLDPRLGSALRQYWQAFYISSSNPGGIVGGLRSVAVRLAHGFTDLPSAVAFVVFVAAGVVVVRTRPNLSILLLTPLLVAVVLALFRIAPIGTGRTDLFLYPVFALLIAVAVSEISTRHSWGVYIAVGLVVASLGLARAPSSYPQEDMRQAIADLNARVQPNDTIMVYSGGRYAFALYAPWPVSVFASKAQTNGFDVRIHRAHTAILGSYGTQHTYGTRQEYRNAVERATRGASRVWFIGSHGRLDELALERALTDSGYHAQARRGNHEAWFLSLWVKTGT